MKRFRFGPERLLVLKGQLEQQAQERQRVARLQFEAAQAEASRLRDLVDRAAGAAEADVGRTVRPDQWTARWHYLTQLSQALAEADVQVQRADRKLQEAHRQRARLATEAEALRHLKQQQWQKHRRETARAVQREADEAALRSRTSGPKSMPANGQKQETSP